MKKGGIILWLMIILPAVSIHAQDVEEVYDKIKRGVEKIGTEAKQQLEERGGIEGVGGSIFGNSGYYKSDSNRSDMNFTKVVNDNSFSTNIPYEVEETASKFIISLIGQCNKGNISIDVISPNGKKFYEMKIHESGDLKWRKSIDLTEEDHKNKTGDWTFIVKGTDTTGFFKISLQSF